MMLVVAVMMMMMVVIVMHADVDDNEGGTNFRFVNGCCHL